jgi:hypothetical protein
MLCGWLALRMNMKLNAKRILCKDQPYHSPTMMNLGDVADVTAGPAGAVAEEYGINSSQTCAAARVEE